MAKKKVKASIVKVIPEEARPVYDEIVQITDQVCRDHLNSDYADSCRQMAGSLACAEPEAILRGKPRSWAAGVIYTVGQLNFLTDPDQTPHMKTDVLADRIGVGQSTMLAKSAEIRSLIQVGTQIQSKYLIPSRVGKVRNLLDFL